MGRVCLILPVSRAAALSHEYVDRCRASLRLAGHDVDVLAVYDPTEPAPISAEAAWRWLPAGWRGLAAAAMTGLGSDKELVGIEWLIVLDWTQGYDPAEIPKILEPLARGEAELTVARRPPWSADSSQKLDSGMRIHRLIAATFGKITRPLVGSSDVFAGLVALTPEAARAVTQQSFQPVGTRFALDLLVRSQGRRVEVAVCSEGPLVRPNLGFDDLRHLKRLADDRFGNASRLIQFCAVGASGMVLDLTCYAVFQLIFSTTILTTMQAPMVGGPLDLAAAGALAIAIALTWNFSLNRRLTFSYARHGSTARQFLTYALSNAVGIALSFSLRLILPAHMGFFQRHKLAAAVVGIIAATGISFSMSRWLVFSRRSVARDLARAEARTASSIP